MHIPRMTKSLALRVEFGDAHYFIARLKALQSVDNNTYGAEIRQWGAAVALLVRDNRHPVFNRVMGMSDETVDVLDEIIDWYRANQRECRFDITPGHVSEKLLAALAKRGFYQSGFQNALYASAQFDNAYVPPQDIIVRRIPPGDKDLMADVYATGFNLAAKLQPAMKDSLKALFASPAARFYGAHINDKLVATGVLFISDSVGYLASGATLPNYRNKGCQGALIQQRITDAALDQCDLVAAQTSFASSGQRNLEKAGLRVAYTKTIWTPRPA
ncbi:MAG TPA: GNAT family N-acetyltransferase [Phototrophicaceae bacterium]|jgi:hypothetical protein|nr:GNAT family N-acetyltransferase [Phototrophicaceae bacterium]